LHCLTLRMKALWPFQMSGTAGLKTRRHIPEQSSTHHVIKWRAKII